MPLSGRYRLARSAANALIQVNAGLCQIKDALGSLHDSLTMMTIFASMSLPVNLAAFVLFAVGVWFAGSRLTYLADELAERLKLAKSLVGLLLLALVTSLPEVATTLSAAVRQNAELVLNNLFGGVALQTAILALADGWARGAVTNYPRKANHALEATLLVVLLALCLTLLLVGEPLAILGIGVGSIAVGASYAGAVWLLRQYDGATDWVPVDLPPAEDAIRVPHIPADTSTASLGLWIAGACAGILALGTALVGCSETLATQSGLGAGFVGATLLAGATSLPELSTTITAVRMGAYTLAISNIFGSNLIMLVLVLPADALYRAGPILRDTGPTVPLAICFGILVTGIYLVGLIVRRKPRIGPLGADSVIVVGVFFVSIWAYYGVS